MTTQDYYLARHLKAIKKDKKKDPNKMTDFVMQLKKLNLKLEAEKETENGREKL
jgi:ATP-dependent Lon protease